MIYTIVYIVRTLGAERDGHPMDSRLEARDMKNELRHYKLLSYQKEQRYPEQQIIRIRLQERK